MKRFVLLMACGVVFGCVNNPPVADGTSYDRAFAIGSLTEEAAILRERFPGARQADVEKVGDDEMVFMHRTEVRGRRMYSIHTLVLPDGTIREVYFDVTARSSLGAQRPNQTLEPTEGAVMPRAGARVTPAPSAAHL